MQRLAFSLQNAPCIEARNVKEGYRIQGIANGYPCPAARSTAFRIGICNWTRAPARLIWLVITPSEKNVATVDNLEVAQFVYLMLSSEKIRDVLTTIGQKGVLLLGRFSPERSRVLSAFIEREKMTREADAQPQP